MTQIEEPVFKIQIEMANRERPSKHILLDIKLPSVDIEKNAIPRDLNCLFEEHKIQKMIDYFSQEFAVYKVLFGQIPKTQKEGDTSRK